MGKSKPVKVETWKGKRQIVARDEKGRFLGRAKYKPGTLEDKVKVFKAYKSLDEKVTRRRLGKGLSTNVIETTDFRSRPRIDERGTWVNATIKIDGREISARSRRVTSRSELETAKREAEENVYAIAGALLFEDYDPGDREMFADMAREKIESSGRKFGYSYTTYRNR